MTIENGRRVKVHYRGTLDDGTEFDNSYQRGEPLEFQVGAGQVITGFDEAVGGMDEGEKLSVRIPADNAYGPHHEAAVQQVEVDRLPQGAEVGLMLQATTEDGRPIAGTIVDMDEATATIDFNHPLAGQDLTFELELVEVVGD